MAKSYYTTSEAAKILAVSPDTVLKWVRAGKIASYRTPGGHSRIPAEAVDELLPANKDGEENGSQIADQHDYRYCWDFNAGPEGITTECLDCVAFKTRARRCYEMRDILEEYGHLLPFCKSDCGTCEFFRLTRDTETTILLISSTNKWTKDLVQCSEGSGLQIKVAADEYEGSALIEKLRPDYIIVDCGYGISRTKCLCLNLSKDQRIPYSRIILTSRNMSIKGYCESAVFGWLRKPFTFDQLAECIGRTRLSSSQISSGK